MFFILPTPGLRSVQPTRRGALLQLTAYCLLLTALLATGCTTTSPIGRSGHRPVAPCTLIVSGLINNQSYHLVGKSATQHFGWSQSMGDLIRPGDSLKVTPLSPTADARGAVLLVWSESLWCCIPHRCIAQGRAANGEMYYVLKGDANTYADFPRYTYPEIIGLVDLPRAWRAPFEAQRAK